MNGILNTIASYIHKEDFNEAEKLLLNIKNDDTALTWLSYIYRLQDRYEDEKEILDYAESIGIQNEYLDNRANWHNLPLRNRLVERPALHLEREPSNIPPQEVMDQLCFVFGSDSNYFGHLIEIIESVKATRYYKHIPVCILDCGLKEEEKHFLTKNMKIINIKDPGWDVDIGPQPSYLKAMVARPFLSNHFPQYKYHFWIDVDSWVQDERALDNFVINMVKEDIGISQHHYQRLCDNLNHVVSDDYLSLFSCDDPQTMAAALCLKAGSKIVSDWQKIFTKNVKEKGFNFYSEQRSLNVACIINKFPGIVAVHDHCIDPPFHLDNGILSYNDEIVGIMSLLTTRKAIKYNHEVPLKSSEKFQNLLIQVDKEYQSFAQQYINYPKETIITSIAWRVWPWKDKYEIKQELFKYIKEYTGD